MVAGVVAADARANGRQFITNKSRSGQTGDNWNQGNSGRTTNWRVLFEVRASPPHNSTPHNSRSRSDASPLRCVQGEAYADPHTAERKWKLEQRKKNLTNDGFRYSIAV